MKAMKSTYFLSLGTMLYMVACCSFCALELVHAAMIYESAISLELDITGKAELYDTNGLFEFENIVGSFLPDMLGAPTKEIIHVAVAVHEQSLNPETTLRVRSQLSLIYVAEIPISLPELNTTVENSALAVSLGAQNVLMLYEEIKSTTSLFTIPDEEEPRIGDAGLLTATICLSIAVVTSASVLLYVAGACSACGRCLFNICFEEVIEPDDDLIKQKETFPENEGSDDESRSVAQSSNAGTKNISGILGAVGNDENSNAAFDLDINTPPRHYLDGGASNITGISELDESGMFSPQSDISNRSINTAALGITSMRKLLHIPTADETSRGNDDGSSKQSGSGLSHLILGRFNGNH